MSYRTWTDEDLRKAVASSATKSEVIKKLGLKSTNAGNYRTIDKYIKLLELDTSHFKITITNQFKEYKLSEVLIANSPYTNTTHLKKKLLKHKVLQYKCSECKINKWNGKDINLHLDHINGESSDNRIENLRLLCPNCHSQTATYCVGKKKRNTPVI